MKILVSCYRSSLNKNTALPWQIMGEFMSIPMPFAQMKSLLERAYDPCMHFGTCKQAIFDPPSGLIPRGFLGAAGTPEDVRLVMVLAEPGHPHQSERYSANGNLLEQAVTYTYNQFAKGTDLLHRNVRAFMANAFPGTTFDEQLSRVWITEGRLCSIENEIGNLKDSTCAHAYLSRELSLLPNAVVVGFGGKAQSYLKSLGVPFIAAWALSPPGANNQKAKDSWAAAIQEIRALAQDVPA